MSLGYLLSEAKKNEPKLQGVDAKKEIKNLIDCTTHEEEVKKKEFLDWHQCKHYKQVGAKDTCRLYFSLCAKNNCTEKMRSPKEFTNEKRIK